MHTKRILVIVKMIATANASTWRRRIPITIHTSTLPYYIVLMIKIIVLMLLLHFLRFRVFHIARERPRDGVALASAT